MIETPKINPNTTGPATPPAPYAGPNLSAAFGTLLRLLMPQPAPTPKPQNPQPIAASSQPARTSPARKAPAKKGGKPAPYLKRGRQNWERGKNYTGDGARNNAARLRVLATAQRQQKKA